MGDGIQETGEGKQLTCTHDLINLPFSNPGRLLILLYLLIQYVDSPQSTPEVGIIKKSNANVKKNI